MNRLRNWEGQGDVLMDETCGARGVRECGGTAEQKLP